MKSVDFVDYPVPDKLQRIVEAIRIASGDPGKETLEIKVCPGGFSGLVWGESASGSSPILSISVANSVNLGIPRLFVHGLITEPSTMKFRSERFRTIQFLFKANTLRLLGINPRLGNHSVQSSFSRDGRSMEAALSTAHDVEEKIDILGKSLLASVKEADLRFDSLVEELVEELRNHPGDSSVKDLCHKMGISERTMERRFASNLGISPKLFLRINRAKEAVALINSGKYRRLTDVALAMNYYDQSHFIRDLRHFTFLPPMDLGDPTLDYHQDTNGLAYL